MESNSIMGWQPRFPSTNSRTRSNRRKRAEKILCREDAGGNSSSSSPSDQMPTHGLTDGGNNNKLGNNSAPLKRVCVIDVCNIMHSCSGLALNADKTLKHVERNADAIGLLVVMRQLLLEGYDIRAFLPMSYMDHWKVDNYFILERLHNINLLQLVEVGVHDDRKILDTAKALHGFVLSNDKFYDHVLSDGDLLDVIRDRIVPYVASSIVPEGGVAAMANRGHQYFTGINIQLQPALPKSTHVTPADKEHPVIHHQRAIFSKAGAITSKLLEDIDLLFYYLQQNFCDFLKVPRPPLQWMEPVRQVKPRYFKEFLKLYEMRKIKNFVEEGRDEDEATG